MKEFKLFGGAIIEDVGQYAVDYIKNNCVDHSEIIVYIGTDSKQMRKHTMYATAIAFYHVGKGAHIIFNRTKIPKVKDLFTRLYNEVEMTRRAAEGLNKDLVGNYHFRWTKDNIWVEIGGVKADRLREIDKKEGSDELGNIVEKYNADLSHQKLITCDLDLNPSKMFKSNMVHDAGIGALKGSGFRVRTKPNAWCATCAADLLCK
jgi:predicted RNase H-related nuclease YkuK (DUF458 family)